VSAAIVPLALSPTAQGPGNEGGAPSRRIRSDAGVVVGSTLKRSPVTAQDQDHRAFLQAAAGSIGRTDNHSRQRVVLGFRTEGRQSPVRGSGKRRVTDRCSTVCTDPATLREIAIPISASCSTWPSAACIRMGYRGPLGGAAQVGSGHRRHRIAFARAGSVRVCPAGFGLFRKGAT